MHPQQQQQREVPGVVSSAKTDTDGLGLSVQSADDADRSLSVPSHPDHLTTTITAAAATCVAGDFFVAFSYGSFFLFCVLIHR